MPTPDLLLGVLTMLDHLPFDQIWIVDFEFDAKPGENPMPVCLAARELRSGRTICLSQDEFGRWPPYPIDSKSLFVAYYASAEIGCHLTLGWPMPKCVLDLFVEFRNQTNGIALTNGSGLVGALAHHGLDSIGAAEKSEMRDLVLRGGPWSEAEKTAILDYCESDVAALARLLTAASARDYFERAITLDPQNAEAMVGLAYARTRATFFGWSTAAEDKPAAQMELLTKATAINPGYAFAYYIKSTLL